MLDNIYQEKYVPDEFELEFSNVKLDNGVYLNGKIDRVDLLDSGSGRYLRIIDYKSGPKNFITKNICDGLDLQLLVYLKVLCDKKFIKPGGAFYFDLSDPFVEIKNDPQKHDLEGKIKQKFTMTGISRSEKIQDLINLSVDKAISVSQEIIEGNISIAPCSKTACLHCDYHSICQKKRGQIPV